MTRALIQLSPRGAALYQFLTLIVLLLVLYAIGFCLSAFLELPAGPSAGVVDPALVSRITLRLFKLTVLSGLVGAGVMMAGERLSVRRLAGGCCGFGRRSSSFLSRSAPSILDGALDLAAALILLLVLAATIGGAAVNLRVWQIGLALFAVSSVAAQLRGRRNGGSPARLSHPGRLPHCRAERHVLADAALQPGRSGMGGGRPENCRGAHLPRRRAD